MKKSKSIGKKIATEIFKQAYKMELSDLVDIMKQVKECVDVKKNLGCTHEEVVASGEKNLLVEVFDFFIQEKLKEDSDDIGKYMAYAKIIGEISDGGKKYEDNIRFYEVKDAIRKHIEETKVSCYALRNKILNNCA